MIVHQVYSMIYEKEVKNVFVCDNYEMANYLARATYGDDAFSVDCLQYPCQIGDKYIDNRFYKSDGTTLIKYVPTQEQQVEQLNRANAVLQDELTNSQLALTELYEGLGV